MQNIEFTKGQGTGNDFVLVLDEDGELNLSNQQISKICDRRFGVGADGMILATKTSASEVSGLLDSDSGAQWFMDYRNADGSKAEMCGNGVRVFARFLIANGLAEITGGSTLAIATRNGIKDLTSAATGFAVDLGLFKIEDAGAEVSADGLGVARPGLNVNVGNPHIVVALATKKDLASLQLHQKPMMTPDATDGVNFEFVVPAEPLIQNGVGHIDMRVYERGVGETMSCGTGVAAAALAVRYWAGNVQNFWQVVVPGGVVGVRVFPTEDGEHVGISGPAELSYSGVIAI